ncbi:MucR family transcriptional regulator [Methylobacterium sp. JK268]
MNATETGTTSPGAESLAVMTADIVTAYVSGNALRPVDIAPLVRSVYTALAGLGAPAEPMPVEPPAPPVPIRKTVTAEHIISLEDGKPYKSLKRHLTARGLTPEEYRRKWNLPPDYPMVAAVYAQRRSDLARDLGLGQIRSRRAAERRAAAAAAAE